MQEALILSRNLLQTFSSTISGRVRRPAERCLLQCPLRLLAERYPLQGPLDVPQNNTCCKLSAVPHIFCLYNCVWTRISKCGAYQRGAHSQKCDDKRNHLEPVSTVRYTRFHLSSTSCVTKRSPNFRSDGSYSECLCSSRAEGHPRPQALVLYLYHRLMSYSCLRRT